MSDRTPADVTVADIRRRTSTLYGECAVRFICGCVLRDDTTPAPGWSLCRYHQGYDAAAGYRVVPIPDDNTRALAARLREMAEVVRLDEIVNPPTEADWLDALGRAIAVLDGQPEDRPATCPTCGCDCEQFGRCSDLWHVGGSGDTR